MTVGVITYDPATGAIQDFRHEADHEYTPGANELIAPDDTDWRAVRRGERRVDTSTDPPTLVSATPDPMDQPGVVSAETRELIGEHFRAKGADALGELDAIEGNANIPPEVTAYLQDMFAMHYLTYVALTGDRIDSVEARFFGG